MDCVSCSRKLRYASLNALERSQLDDRLRLSLEEHRQHDDAGWLRPAQGGMDWHVAVRHIGKQDALIFLGALTDEPFAHRYGIGKVGAARIAGESSQRRGFAIERRHLVNGSVLGIDQGRQLRKQHFCHGKEVALPLQHAGEFREIRLEPVLFLVALRGDAKIVDHRVDVVLQLGDFPARVHLDRAREITFGDGGRDLGDGAHLRREVGSEEIDVAGQILPCAGGARDVGLSTEPAFDADFARHVGDLIGKRGEGIGHVIDRLGERGDFALGLDGKLLTQVAGRNRRHHFDNAAHLVSQVGRHDVHGIGEILPGARHAGNLRLAAEFALGADLACNPSDFRRKGVELVHHRVDGVFEFEDLALHVDGDLPGQIAARHGGRHLRDIADLRRQVCAHRVDGIGEVLPRAGHAGHDGLHSQASLGADLACHAGHLRGEGSQLLDHGIDRLLELQDLAADVHGDLAREIAIGHGDGHLRDVADLAVRFDAIEFTLSVRSFHVPATPETCAWPPSLPSVPTSRATRLTSEAKPLS